MESTGKYWIPVYNILEPTCNIVLAHPKYVKTPSGLPTSSSTILSQGVLSLRQISVSLEICSAIVGNSLTLLPVRKTGRKTV